MLEKGMVNRAKGVDDFLKPIHLISDETRVFAKMLRRFVDREILPHEDKLDDYWDWSEREGRTFVHEILEKLLIGLGLQSSFVPLQFGGSGSGSIIDKLVLVEELSRGDYGTATEVFVTSWSIAALLLPKPNELLLNKLAPLLCGDKKYVICSAITEPHAGGSVEDVRLKGSQIRTRARLEGNEWVINGHKLWPSAHREANMFRVLCTLEGQEFPNIAQIFVPADAQGLATSKPYRKMGASIDTNGDIWFDNVRVPRENRAHEDPQEELMSLIANVTLGRLNSSAFPIGIMKRAYEILRDYVNNREIAGKPMKEHGTIVYELGQIAREIMAAEAFLYYVGERMDRPEVYGFPWEHKSLATASALQNTVSSLGWSLVSRAVELMGSYGYSREGKMEKLLRDLKITQIVVGGPILRLTELARYYFGTETI